MVDYFKPELALDPSTNSAVAGAVATVYAATDTGLTTPLTVTDLYDVPLAGNVLTSGPGGIYPAFKVATGETDVLAVSGSLVTPITSVQGNKGDPGDPGPAGVGLPDPTSLADDLTVKTSGGAWVTGTAPSGREVQLQATSSAIQWRYVGDVAWTVLVNLSDLKGADGAAGAAGAAGQSPQIRVSGGYLQWKLSGDATWQNLIAISDIGGGNGQFRYLVSGVWQARGSSTYPVWFDAGAASSPPKPTDIQVGDHAVTINPVSWT